MYQGRVKVINVIKSGASTAIQGGLKNLNS